MKEIVPDFDPKTQIGLSSISGKGFYVIDDFEQGLRFFYVLKDWKVSLDFHLNFAKYKTLNSVEELRNALSEWLYSPYASLLEFTTEKELIDWLKKN